MLKSPQYLGAALLAAAQLAACTTTTPLRQGYKDQLRGHSVGFVLHHRDLNIPPLAMGSGRAATFLSAGPLVGTVLHEGSIKKAMTSMALGSPLYAIADAMKLELSAAGVEVRGSPTAPSDKPGATNPPNARGTDFAIHLTASDWGLKPESLLPVRYRYQFSAVVEIQDRRGDRVLGKTECRFAPAAPEGGLTGAALFDKDAELLRQLMAQGAQACLQQLANPLNS